MLPKNYLTQQFDFLMNVVNKIKRKLSSIKSTEERSPKELQQLLSQCDAKITELNEKLLAAQNQSSILRQSLDSKVAEINVLRVKVSSLEEELKKLTDDFNNVKSSNDELRNNNLHLQEENERLIGRSSSTVSKLMSFCELLKSMGISSVEDCIAIIKNEIKQSTTEMGFDIIDSYEGEFNPEIHNIINTQSTDDSKLNNHIAKVVRPGVWYDNKCLIPQDVIVYTVNQ